MVCFFIPKNLSWPLSYLIFSTVLWGNWEGENIINFIFHMEIQGQKVITHPKTHNGELATIIAAMCSYHVPGTIISIHLIFTVTQWRHAIIPIM